MILLLVFAILLRILIGLKTAQIDENAVHLVELQKIALAPTYILSVTSLNTLIKDGWIDSGDFDGNKNAFEVGQISLMR